MFDVASPLERGRETAEEEVGAEEGHERRDPGAVGAPHRELARRVVRPKPELLHGALHCEPGRLSDATAAVDNPANGGNPDAGPLGDIVDGMSVHSGSTLSFSSLTILSLPDPMIGSET